MQYYSIDKLFNRPFFVTIPDAPDFWPNFCSVDVLRISDLAKWGEVISKEAMSVVSNNINIFTEKERLDILLRLAHGSYFGILEQLVSRPEGLAFVVDSCLFRGTDNPSCRPTTFNEKKPSELLSITSVRELAMTINCRSGITSPPNDTVKEEMVGDFLDLKTMLVSKFPK